MSDLTFPILLYTYNVFKTPTWATRTQRAVSGRERTIQDYANPIWNFKLRFDILRDRQIEGGFTSELRKLMDFFLLMNGSYDTFLFDDESDNHTVDEELALVECTDAQFQLRRRLYENGFPEDIIAPNVITEIKVDGTPTEAYTVDMHTGIVTLDSPPAVDAIVTATYSYYFRCRFMTDSVDFERFSHLRWQLQEIKFKSIVL